MVVEEDNRFYEQLKGGGGRRKIIDGGGDGKRTIKPQLKPPLFAQIDPLAYLGVLPAQQNSPMGFERPHRTT